MFNVYSAWCRTSHQEKHAFRQLSYVFKLTSKLFFISGPKNKHLESSRIVITFPTINKQQTCLTRSLGNENFNRQISTSVCNKLPCEQRFRSCIAFSVYGVVRVACHWRSWPKQTHYVTDWKLKRTTSSMLIFKKAIQERNLCSQGSNKLLMYRMHHNLFEHLNALLIICMEKTFSSIRGLNKLKGTQYFIITKT